VLSNHCWSGYWITANRRALASLVEIVNRNFDAAALIWTARCSRKNRGRVDTRRQVVLRPLLRCAKPQNCSN
jgi:hypothetical protein